MQHLTYIKTTSKSFHEKVVFLFVLFAFLSFFLNFQRKVQLSFRKSCSILEPENFANQMKFWEGGDRGKRKKIKRNWTKPELTLEEKVKDNSYENYANYRYIFDICEYVSHRRNEQSMWGSSWNFSSSHRQVFPSLSAFCWLCLRMRFVFPVYTTQWALIEIVIFDSLLT